MAEQLIGYTDVDAAKGIPLEFALTYYAAYLPVIDANGHHVANLYSGLAWRAKLPAGHPHALTPADRSQLRSIERSLKVHFVMLLRAGKLVARGYLPNSVALEEIPSNWWWDVEINIEDNWVEAHGSRIQGVSIFKGPSPDHAHLAPQTFVCAPMSLLPGCGSALPLLHSAAIKLVSPIAKPAQHGRHWTKA
jgi:hypothetical protein